MSDRYHPSPDQVALVNSLSESLAAILPLSRLHQSNEESAQTWTALAELGVFAIATPEEQGGSGLGAVEEALIALELGRRAAAPSVFATIIATHLCTPGGRFPGRSDDGPSEVAQSEVGQSGLRVAVGYRRGDRVVMVEESGASLFLVRGELGSALFELPHSTRVIDDRLWSARVLEVTGLGAPLATGEPLQALRLRLVDAAALAGLACAAQDMAVEYARLREQFGRPIGSFQAVKHHCANMALAARCAADQVSFAAVALDDGRDDAALQVESAFFVAASAAIENCGKNIQVHGGIGFSDEADPHQLLKRARVFVEVAGGLDSALARIADCAPASELVQPRRGIGPWTKSPSTGVR